jgi:putative tricarboxylic transport membrane protein
MRVDRVAGGTLLLVGAAVGLEATTYDVTFMTDPVGPKALPFLVSAIVVLAGLATLLRPRASVPLPERRTAVAMAAAVAAFLLYAVALPFLGFFTSTTLVVLALALLYRGPSLPSLGAALALSGGLWLLFAALLSLPLPVGSLWIR